MKKFIAIAAIAISVVSCNDEAKTTSSSQDTINVADTSANAANRDTTTTTTTTTYRNAEGDVTYRNKKVMVWRNGAWVETNEDVKLDNDVVVYRDGRVTRQGKVVRLEEGVVVNRSGNFFDRTGQTIEHAWDKTKEGVKDAGKAVGNAAEKAAHKVKDAVDKDKN